MLTRTVPDSHSFVEPHTASAGVYATARRLFESLEPLHGQPAGELETMERAAAGMRFIRSMGGYSQLAHDLFRIALDEADAAGAFVVEAAACYAADCVPISDDDRVITHADHHRALWLGSILRLADGLCGSSGAAPDDVWAVWTDRIVYLEFRGGDLSDHDVASAKMRVAALEALTGRAVLMVGSFPRRGAA